MTIKSTMDVQFDREMYLELADVFERSDLYDVSQELCEFNEDPEDLAYELACTRYALARTEKQLFELRSAVIGALILLPRDNGGRKLLEKEIGLDA